LQCGKAKLINQEHSGTEKRIATNSCNSTYLTPCHKTGEWSIQIPMYTALLVQVK